MKKTPPANKPQPLPDVKFHPGLPERLMEAAALLLVVVNWGYIYICASHTATRISPLHASWG